VTARERAEFVDAIRHMLGLDPIPDSGVERARVLHDNSHEMTRIAAAVCGQVGDSGNRWARPPVQ
jgi:hypothetical protein